MVFAADEYYLMAERTFPAGRHLRGLPPARERAGHGPGLRGRLRWGRAGRPRGAPGILRRRGRCARCRLPGRRGRDLGGRATPAPTATPIAILTGEYGARVLGPLVDILGRDDIRVVPVSNGFFGGNIGVSGLLTGTDLSDVLDHQPEGHRYLLPDACLSEGRFLDDLTVADLPRSVEVVATDGLSLRRALDSDGRPTGVGPRSGPRGCRSPSVRPDDRRDHGDHWPGRPPPLVVIAGRPNVGKSTLVNRIVGRRAAVVEERPGVTRDRKELEAEWCGRAFTVVDTGGWLASDDPLDAQVSAQAERAMAEADVVLLVVDVTVGLIDEDLAVARVLKRSGRPVRVVVNKVDSSQREADAWDAMALGLGTPWPISALHGRGTGDLLDDVVSLLPDAGRRGRGHRPRRAGAGEGSATATAPRPGGPAASTTGVPGSPSWVGPTSASRRCSTGWWAMSGPWSTTPRAPPGTPWTPWWRRRRGRCASSTPPACAASPGPSGDRVLLGAPGPRRPRPVGHRPAGHRRHRRGHPPGPAPGRAGGCGRLPDRGGAEQVGADRRPRTARTSWSTWGTGWPSSATPRCCGQRPVGPRRPPHPPGGGRGRGGLPLEDPHR